MILIFELVSAGLMVLVLDEISKGYGLDSGISLFIATTISENIMLKSFSPLTIISECGIEYEGAIITTDHLLMAKKINSRQFMELFIEITLLIYQI